ncbi:hypothetical protein EYF80_000086 [Liparis tanakae]|uniref:Uncharacterized protein n=1 Tax=Liparis tanakae TaxID=230148 RepID=A0A4Z2JI45_9TELE|nr:hypothetical protein EYF80_000086 [Liparis tanakae]
MGSTSGKSTSTPMAIEPSDSLLGVGWNPPERGERDVIFLTQEAAVGYTSGSEQLDGTSTIPLASFLGDCSPYRPHSDFSVLTSDVTGSI